MDLQRLPRELFLWTLGAAMLLAIVQTWRLSRQRSVQRRRLAAARERGALGEARAEALLEQRWFTVLDRQVTISYEIYLDEAPFWVDLRADYLVGLDEKRYIAEVKTGRLAPRLDTQATRRQLLEYRLAFDVDGVLLVDAEAARIYTITFPPMKVESLARANGSGGWLVWLLVGLVTGFAAAAFARF